MALKAILANISEVDEKYRDLYTQRGDKWEFTGVEGVKTQGDIDRLNAAHTKVKNDLVTAKAELAAAKTAAGVWEDLDPEDVKTRLERLATLEAGSTVPELAKNFETTVSARVAQVLEGKVKTETTKLQRKIDELTAKVGEQNTAIQTYESHNATRTVHDAVRAEAVRLKVIPEALPDLLLVAGQELKLVEGKVVTEDGRDPAAVLEDYKQKRPYFWPQAQGTGASGGTVDLGGGVQGDNPFARATYNRTKAGALLNSNPAQAAKLAEQAGVPKTEDGASFQWHVMPPEKK